MESVKETWATINDFARAHTGVQAADEADSPMARKDTSDTESQGNFILSFFYFVLFIVEEIHSKIVWLQVISKRDAKQNQLQSVV